MFFSHGLSGTLTSVVCSFSNNAITGYSWSANTTTVAVTVAGTLSETWTSYATVNFKPV